MNMEGYRVQKTYRKAGESPERNRPCPCRSGKKYKRCCFLKMITQKNEFFKRREAIVGTLQSKRIAVDEILREEPKGNEDIVCDGPAPVEQQSTKS